MDRQVGKNTQFLQALKHAINGMLFAFKQERNVKYHLVSGSAVVLLGIVLHCTVSEWLWLLFSIAFVFAMEFINTIIEEIVDVITQRQYAEWAKHVKDLAAATVVIAALFALSVGVIIFIPKLLHL